MLDHLVIYRTNGTGTIWILKHATLTKNWLQIGGIFQAGSSVTAISRDSGVIDLFICGLNGRVYTS